MRSQHHKKQKLLCSKTQGIAAASIPKCFQGMEQPGDVSRLEGLRSPFGSGAARRPSGGQTASEHLECNTWRGLRSCGASTGSFQSQKKCFTSGRDLSLIILPKTVLYRLGQSSAWGLSSGKGNLDMHTRNLFPELFDPTEKAFFMRQINPLCHGRAGMRMELQIPLKPLRICYW